MKNITTNKAAPVSVVVVNCNAGNLLAKCVSAALAQAREVIVVDNASTDSSLKLPESIHADNTRLKIVRNETNLGFAAGCNIGAQQSSEPYILFLNPDCILAPASLQRMLETLNISLENGMVGGLLLGMDGREQGGGRRAVPTPWRSFVRAFGLTRLASRWPRLFSDFHLHEQPLPAAPILTEAISGALMLVRRDALQEIGWWDEGYFLHCEDLDLCMRFRKKGLNILFDPKAPAIHIQGACSKSRPVFVEWHKHKGMVRFYRKFFRHQYPGLLMWAVIAGVWIRFVLVALIKTCSRKESQIQDSEINFDWPEKLQLPSHADGIRKGIDAIAVMGSVVEAAPAMPPTKAISGTNIIAYPGTPSLEQQHGHPAIGRREGGKANPAGRRLSV